ncbi:MAG: hypothetical protein IT285_05205 [Bdellovibrionales bacterium]|nr:hypothetical protein [Bdellovibrionales bacterium]
MGKPKGSKRTSTHNEPVQCDLEFPRLVQELVALEHGEAEQFFDCVEKLQRMTWAQILATSSKTQKRGLNWEVLDQTTASGAVIASIRVSAKFRARVTRDGALMRFISLHPDHDGAYGEGGGEDL